jgi:hypothetical protein
MSLSNSSLGGRLHASRIWIAALVAVLGLGRLSLAQELTEKKSANATTEMDETKTRTSGKAKTGSLELRLGYYDSDDSDAGNPFLDETLSVVEPILYFDYNFDERYSMWAKVQGDIVSSASIERLSKFPEQSGATGDYYVGASGGFDVKSDDRFRYGLWGHVSFEYDYRSFGLGGSMAWDSEDRNATDKVSANVFFDQLDVIRFNGVQEGSDSRLSLTAGYTRYQVFTPELHGEFGLTLTHQDGFLSTPYNAVVIEDPALPPNSNLVGNVRGEEVAERMPDSRTRFSFFGRMRHHLFESSAAELGARLYSDTWGITSISLEPRYFTWILDQTLSTELRYRYYTQTAADDYREHFYDADRGLAYFTQDSDLGEFDSHSFGGSLHWRISDRVSLGFDGDYVIRSDNLDYFFASLAVAWEF